MSTSRRREVPTGEELGSVEFLVGRDYPNFVSMSFEVVSTERGCKIGVRVVPATLKGFEWPWSI